MIEDVKRSKNDCEDHDLLIRIDERLAKLCSTFEQHICSTDRNFTKVTERIEKLEAWKTYMSGSLAIIGVIFTALQAKIMRWI
jgi:hypothetical protein